MTRIKQGLQTILNGVSANIVGVALPVAEYKAICMQLFTSGSATATIKMAASMSAECPDFSIPPSATNKWGYVEIVWLDNNSSLPGSNGIVLAGTDVCRLYEVNTNFIKWLCPIVTGWSAGVLTLEADAVNDYTR